MLAKLLSILLLFTFLGINLFLIAIRAFKSITAGILRKILRVELPENEKKDIERIYTLVWIAVGIWAFLRLWNWGLSGLIASIFGFLAFRSGANITRTLVYAIHDHKVIGEYTENSKLLETLGTAAKLSILLETMFIVAFALAYKTLSATLNTGGMRANTFILYLWLSGLAFGLLFGWFIARNNRGILLRNAIATVGFFTTKKGKRKTEETVRKTKEIPKKFSRKLPKLPR